MPSKIITGSLGSVTPGTSQTFRDSFNISLTGTAVATVQIEKSYDRQNVANDGAATWTVVSKDASGAAASFTTYPVNVVLNEPEIGIYYRVNCTAYTSGSVAYRLSQ